MSNTENTITREQAQTNLNDMLKFQSGQKARLAAAVAAVVVAKNDVTEADGMVLLARAALARLGGPVKVQQAVVEFLRAAGTEGMTTDELFAALTEQGFEMGGANPRANLGAYIARWSKVGTGIVSAGRGRWGFAGQIEAVPSFLAPVEPPKADESVPSFLTGVDTAIAEAEGSPLPDGFPGREALAEAGFHSVESLADKTHDQLRRIKGIGAQTARDILATLNPEA